MSGADAIESGLRDWFVTRWDETHGPSASKLEIARLDRLSKGQSSDLMQVSVRRGESAGDYILRAEPRAKQLFHKPDIMREAATLKALADYENVPAPKVWWTEADDSILGAPFFVMSHVEGRVPLGRPSLHLAGFLPEVSEQSRDAMSRSAIAALAAVHAVDWRRTHAFLAPADMSRGYLGAYLKRLEDWYLWTTRGRSFPLTDAALAYLLEQGGSIDDSDPVLVWNDARVGNMIFHNDKVAAVIDWEDPIIAPAGIDLGYWLMMDEFHAESIGVKRLPGWPSQQETIDRYTALSGRTVDNVDYFILMGAFFIATTLIRQADIGVEQGRLQAGTTMGRDNTTTQIIARILGLPIPELSEDFIRHRQLEKLMR